MIENCKTYKLTNLVVKLQNVARLTQSSIPQFIFIALYHSLFTKCIENSQALLLVI